MRKLLSVLALLLAAFTLNAQDSNLIRVYAKVVDWRGRPVPKIVVSLFLTKHINPEAVRSFSWDFQTDLEGLVVLTAPPGLWQLDAEIFIERRGHPMLEQNFIIYGSPPLFPMNASNDPKVPFVIRLNMPVWSEGIGDDIWLLDMTSPTQGQTFRMDDLSALPIR